MGTYLLLWCRKLDKHLVLSPDPAPKRRKKDLGTSARILGCALSATFNRIVWLQRGTGRPAQHGLTALTTHVLAIAHRRWALERQWLLAVSCVVLISLQLWKEECFIPQWGQRRCPRVFCQCYCFGIFVCQWHSSLHMSLHLFCHSSEASCCPPRSVGET